MGQYLKTIYPGIFRYVGKNRMVYGIDYYAGGKKHREIVGPLLTEARQKLEERRALAKRGGFMSLASQRKITFQELADKYAEMQGRGAYFEGSRRYFLKVLLEFFGQRRLCQITPLDIEDFKKRRKETPLHSGKARADASINRELETLRHMLNKAVEWGMMAENPFSKFNQSIFFEERNDRCRYLSEEEIRRLLAACPAYLRNIVQAALLTGLRKSDLLKLKWSDVNLERRILYFNEQKKRGKRGAKVLNGDLVDLLRGIGQNGSEYVLTGSNGKPLKDVKRPFKTALKRAGIADFRFHDLRHTSASYLVMRGASMKSVQEHLGHTSLAMTERYSHLSPEYMRSEVERLNGLCAVGVTEVSSKKLVRNGQMVDLLFQSGSLPSA